MATTGSSHLASAASTETESFGQNGLHTVDISPAAADITVTFKKDAATVSEVITIPAGASKTFLIHADSVTVTRASGATAVDIFWEPGSY